MPRARRATPKQFVQAWQEATTVADVTARLRITPSAAYARRRKYAEHGVPLKQLDRVNTVDWDELAEYAASFQNGNG